MASADIRIRRNGDGIEQLSDELFGCAEAVASLGGKQDAVCKHGHCQSLDIIGGRKGSAVHECGGTDCLEAGNAASRTDTEQGEVALTGRTDDGEDVFLHGIGYLDLCSLFHECTDLLGGDHRLGDIPDGIMR